MCFINIMHDPLMEDRKTTQNLNISLNINIHMVVKTVTITEGSYNKLKRLKRESESFSDLFNRLADERLNIASRFRGIIKMSSQEIDEWRKNLAINKKVFSGEAIKKQKRLEARMRELGM